MKLLYFTLLLPLNLSARNGWLQSQQTWAQSDFPSLQLEFHGTPRTWVLGMHHQKEEKSLNPPLGTTFVPGTVSTETGLHARGQWPLFFPLLQVELFSKCHSPADNNGALRVQPLA